MNNNTEKIGRYLQNEMSAEERIAFEKQLAADKGLKQELQIQEQITNAVKTAGLKNEFGKAIRTKFINKLLIQFGIGVIILVAAAFVFYALKADRIHDNEADSLKINNTGTNPRNISRR